MDNISKIVRYRYKDTGMLSDYYWVYYKNSKIWRKCYHIKGCMIDKHFNYIMDAKCEKITDKNGRTKGFIYTI